MRKLKHTIEIPDTIRKTVYKVAHRIKEEGFDCFLIGGSVRDLILGIDIFDYDFATNARPDQIIRIFKRTVPTGIKHGTITVLLDGYSFEITTFRSDGTYCDGRRPEDVSFSESLEVDVLRRDFTINGLAFDLDSGRIVDYVSGLEDLEKGIIRTIGDPVERFSEDGLRPVRACRFAAKLNFEIEDQTFKAITGALPIVKKVSIERIRDEFMKMLEAGVPSIGIELLRETGILELFLPELAAGYGLEQNRFHMHDIYYHSIYSCDAGPSDRPYIRLAALLHDIGKVPTRRMSESGDYTFYNHEVVSARMAKRIMKRLKFSNDQIEKVTNLIINHMFHYTDEWTDGAVRRFIRKTGLGNINDLFLLRRADRMGNGSRSGLPAPISRLKQRIEKVLEQENAFSIKDLNINGRVLMDAFERPPGPWIGEILRELLELVLDDPELNIQEQLLARAKDIIDLQKR